MQLGGTALLFFGFFLLFGLGAVGAVGLGAVSRGAVSLGAIGG